MIEVLSQIVKMSCVLLSISILFYLFLTLSNINNIFLHATKILSLIHFYNTFLLDTIIMFHVSSYSSRHVDVISVHDVCSQCRYNIGLRSRILHRLIQIGAYFKIGAAITNLVKFGQIRTQQRQDDSDQTTSIRNWNKIDISMAMYDTKTTSVRHQFNISILVSYFRRQFDVV